ncbi:SGNH/GDSL hydrolase family protein [Streptococcus equinus]|uniref:SGNH/GDSL hydrolase family protein n=1 Tax=Streptococcus equinus TaxID=1335 RepID=UPI0008E1B369|nr:SGNH/GDSL hydrolase family protein [Streptococcus equinus]SFG02605.1 Lysophospholipase L1 [Streptococcus equinus]
MEIRKNDRIVFFGDSITEWGRDKADPASLGTGFVSLVVADLLEHHQELNLQFFNRGIGGNKVQDLLDRVDADCLSLNPDVVILMVGINDVWHLVGKDGFASDGEQERFETIYRQLLQSLKSAGVERILLMEPYVLDYPEDRMTWRKDLDPKIQIVRHLAREFSLELIPLDGLMNEQALLNGRRELTGEDGVHPTLAGATVIAQEILKRLTFVY